MKKPILLIGILILILMLMAMVLCGCGSGGQDGASGDASTNETEDAAADENSDDAYGQLGFDLMEAESQFILQNATTASEMVELFGEPEEKSEAEIWGADGMEHQTWTYPTQGLELDLVREEDNVQIVDMITLFDPSTLKTSKGIGIGSSKEDVEALYKGEINPDAGDESTIVAGTVYGGVIFQLENGKVSSIFVGASAE